MKNLSAFAIYDSLVGLQAAVAHIRGPLTAHEIAHIEAGLTYYGRQARKPMFLTIHS